MIAARLDAAPIATSGHARDPEVCQDGDEDEGGRGDVERRPGVADPLADRPREQDDLQREPGDRQHPPAELEIGQTGRPPTEQETQQEPDRQRVEQEHQAPTSAGWAASIPNRMAGAAGRSRAIAASMALASTARAK